MQPLDLLPHPEGGAFREVFRSTHTVLLPNGQSRAALTHIYFALRPGEVSRFHQVAADEVWNLYQGDGVHLYLWDGSRVAPQRITLAAAQTRFCQVVPAGFWQAAEPMGEGVLVGCSVAPGFEFADFRMIEPDSPTAQRLLGLGPEWDRFVRPNPAGRPIS